MMNDAAVVPLDLRTLTSWLAGQGLALLCWTAVVALGCAAWRRRRENDMSNLVIVGGIWLAVRLGLLVAGLPRPGQPGDDCLALALDLTGLVLLVWPFLAPPLPARWADRMAGVGLSAVALACGVSLWQWARDTLGLPRTLHLAITWAHSMLALAGLAALNLSHVPTRRRDWLLTTAGALLVGIAGWLIPLRGASTLSPVLTAATAALAAAWLNWLEHLPRKAAPAAPGSQVYPVPQAASHLMEASVSLFAARDLVQLLKAAATALAHIIEVRLAALLLVENGSAETSEPPPLRLVARWPQVEDSQPASPLLSGLSPALADALMQGRAVNATHRSHKACLEPLESILGTELKAALILPLLPPASQERLNGGQGLLVLGHDGVPPDAYKLQLCRILAEQVAIVAHYIQLRARIGQQSRTLAHLARRQEQEPEQALAELQERNRQLEEEAQQLRQLDQLKSQFIAQTSHELRTPLNSIIGFSGLMLKGIDGQLTDIQRQDIEAILASGKHLLKLINDILDVSQIWAGKMNLTLSDVDLPKLVENTLTIVAPLIGDKPVELGQALAPDLPAIRADKTRIRQVLLNLLANAVRHTERGHVTVSASREEDRVVISVADTGAGIPPEHLQTIFEESARSAGPSRRKTEGLGLGLAISRQLVELHGGQIWVESKVGVGSTFYFSLPIRRPQPDLAGRKITRGQLEAALAQWQRTAPALVSD